MKPATRLIHVAEGINHDAAPLTTPIYETTTFLFENANEVRDYNEGRSPKFRAPGLNRSPDWRQSPR